MMIASVSQANPQISGPRLIEVFRPGTFTPVSGEAITFSASDVEAMARIYDAVSFPAPAVVGHPALDAPAYGWAKGFRWDGDTQRLVAEMGEMDASFEDAVAAGRYKKISMALFSPDAPNNPKPGQWYPKHIGFLGAAAPAVSGLKPVAFAADQTGVHVFEFGDGVLMGDMTALRDVAGLFWSLREWIIEKFGAEAADKTLPSWSISWIDEAARPSTQDNHFAAPQEKSSVTPQSTANPTNPQPASPSVDEAVLQARLSQIEARERAADTAENIAFAEKLVGEGRLTPAVKDRAVALLNALPGEVASEQQIAFAEGSVERKVAPRLLLQEILSALPQTVTFGQTDIGTIDGVASFASPDGRPVDPEQALIHAKAVAYQVSHPGTDYMAAVTAVNR
jgi:hypothetical protein